MKVLIITFLGMFVYGTVSGNVGIGLLSLFCGACLVHFDKKMRRNEARWARDPRNAKVPHTTSKVLSDYETETSDRRFGL